LARPLPLRAAAPGFLDTASRVPQLHASLTQEGLSEMMTDAHRQVVERDIEELRRILREYPAAYIHLRGMETMSLAPVEHLLEAYDEALKVDLVGGPE